MSYAPPPGPHGGIPHQQQAQQAWGAAQPPPPYRGPQRPRKLLVAIVGLFVAVAVLSTFAYWVQWTDNLGKEIGVNDISDFKELPGPRGMAPLGPPAAAPGGAS